MHYINSAGSLKKKNDKNNSDGPDHELKLPWGPEKLQLLSEVAEVQRPRLRPRLRRRILPAFHRRGFDAVPIV